jgi:predicted nucleotidyltransferase
MGYLISYILFIEILILLPFLKAIAMRLKKMLKELLKNKGFLKIIKEFLKKKEILDIILFGSSVRGKEEPNDIDILIVYTKDVKNINNINYELRKELEKISKNFEIIGKEYPDLFKIEFLARSSILSEGYSFLQNKFFVEGLNFKNLILFKYSLDDMNKSKRMIFYYALNGRGKDIGLLKKYECIKFSDNIILSPMESSDSIKEFFKMNKIKFLEIPILILENILKHLLIV